MFKTAVFGHLLLLLPHLCRRPRPGREHFLWLEYVRGQFLREEGAGGAQRPPLIEAPLGRQHVVDGVHLARN